MAWILWNRQQCHFPRVTLCCRPSLLCVHMHITHWNNRTVDMSVVFLSDTTTAVHSFISHQNHITIIESQSLVILLRVGIKILGFPGSHNVSSHFWLFVDSKSICFLGCAIKDFEMCKFCLVSGPFFGTLWPIVKTVIMWQKVSVLVWDLWYLCRNIHFLWHANAHRVSHCARDWSIDYVACNQLLGTDLDLPHGPRRTKTSSSMKTETFSLDLHTSLCQLSVFCFQNLHQIFEVFKNVVCLESLSFATCLFFYAALLVFFVVFTNSSYPSFFCVVIALAKDTEKRKLGLV